MDLIALPTAELARVVETALEEDLGPGDATSNGLFDADDTCRAALLLKQPGVVCGLRGRGSGVPRARSGRRLRAARDRR